MKKWFLWAVLCMACVGFSACGGDDEEEVSMNVQSVICDRVWVKDGNKNGYVKFYRNHMVELSGGANAAGGALAGGESLFFGEWSASGDKLRSSFTTGSYGGVDLRNMLYGTLTLTKNNENTWLTFKEMNECEHSFMKKATFTDYTDDTAHDKALHGRWNMTVYADGQAMPCVMTIRKDGTMNYEVKTTGLDVNTSYTTKNGRVEIKDFIVPDNRAAFLYVREDDVIKFFSEENAVKIWQCEKLD